MSQGTKKLMASAAGGMDIEEVAANTPYDEFARKILTASGSNKDNPAASYYKILREPDENTWLIANVNTDGKFFFHKVLV